jgi:hexosaminidase
LNNFERVVHIDLKGAPPKPDYFEKFIPFLKEQGATGILLEYEDMFPYKGRLAEAKHGNAYSLNDIKLIKKLAAENNLYIMPLVQTYGHLEWILKIKSFSHLREDAQFPQVITPCLEESYTVIFGK